MRSLWRALVVAWLGGVGSPALMDDYMIDAQTEVLEQADVVPAGVPRTREPLPDADATSATGQLRSVAGSVMPAPVASLSLVREGSAKEVQDLAREAQ
jgi:hypothetical protein